MRHESALGCWQMAVRQPHAALRPHVTHYTGWFEHMAAPLCRRELPTELVPVILNFGSPVRVFDAGDSSRYADLGSFTAGAYDTYVRVGSSGPSGGVQINFTLFGLRLLLNRPLGSLRNRCVPLDDVLGPLGSQLTEQMYEAPTWDARFDILDRTFIARIGAARSPSAQVAWTWKRMVESRGRVSIGRLVDEVGWSQKHLIARFREDIGLSPKSMARVLRFSRAAELLRRADGSRLADIAQDCGYYDQAHFTRDFRAFAGVTPSELVASLLPDHGGILAD